MKLSVAVFREVVCSGVNWVRIALNRIFIFLVEFFLFLFLMFLCIGTEHNRTEIKEILD